MYRPPCSLAAYRSFTILLLIPSLQAAPTPPTSPFLPSFLPSFIGDLCRRDNPCVAEAKCVIDPAAPIVGRPFCICPTGFEGDGRADGEGCADIDECASGLDDCLIGAERCANTPGSFQCDCLAGFHKTQPFGHCHDIDECRLPNACNGPDVSCHNLPGSHACVCHNEHKEWTGSECVMRDICEGDGGIYNPCDTTNGLCVNTLEGPQCFCKPGYRLASNGVDCEDVDECELGTHRCPKAISHCTNIQGSYRCDCDESLGYTNVGPFQCGNLNECEKYKDVCSDPKFFCCMDLPPPQKFVCSPPMSAFAEAGISPSSWQAAYAGREPPHLSSPETMDTARSSEMSATQSPVYVNGQDDEPLIDWMMDGVRLMKHKQKNMYTPGTILEQWTPPAINNLRSKVTTTVKRMFTGDLRNVLEEESAPAVRRLQAEPFNRWAEHPSDVAERAARRFAEAAISMAPAVIPSVFTKSAHAQCPAGFVNLFSLKQRSAIEKVPEAAGQVVGFMKQFLPTNYGGKIDPNAVAVGVATNANSLANSLSSWYKAFIALPEALQGATANVSALNVKNDLEDLITSGANAAQPMLDLIGNVANAAQLVKGEGLRGSGPITAPIANI